MSLIPHLFFEVAVVAVFCELVQIDYELFGRLSVSLTPSVEPRPFVNDVCLTLKCSSNFCRIFLLVLWSSSVALVEVSTDSASYPMQYSRVLTCCTLSEVESPEAIRNCSNLHFQRGLSSGFRKSKFLGGSRRSSLLLLFYQLPPCNVSYCSITVFTMFTVRLAQ